MKRISDLTIDLKEEYKNSLLIQHCRGDDKDPSRRLILQKYLKEKYASRFKEELSKESKKSIRFRGGVSKDKEDVNTYAEDYFDEMCTPAFFRILETTINWNMFEKDGLCANDALVYYKDYPELGYGPIKQKERCKNKSKFTCSKCMKVSYCSKDCSIQYWQYHKKICKEIRKIASEVD